MSSTQRKITGGAFGKANRFHTPKWGDTPGMKYDLHDMNHSSNHVQSPLMRGEPAKPDKPGTRPSMPNPSKDRTAWMIGKTKNDMAYFSNVADIQGPAAHRPNMDVVKTRSNRVLFTRYTRDNAMEATLTCTPGPAYFPEKSAADFTRDKPPAWNMGPAPADPNSRQAFIFGKVKNGYMYRAIPATSEKGAIVTPMTYEPKYLEHFKRRSIQQKWGRAERFHITKKKKPLNLYGGKKHAKASAGIDSPGPIYESIVGNIEHFTKKGNTSTPAGRWCP